MALAALLLNACKQTTMYNSNKQKDKKRTTLGMASTVCNILLQAADCVQYMPDGSDAKSFVKTY